MAFVSLSSIMASTSVVAVLTILIVAFIANRVYIWYRLRHIPGPASAGFSMWWMLSNTMKGHMHLSLYDVCEEYGR